MTPLAIEGMGLGSWDVSGMRRVMHVIRTEMGLARRQPDPEADQDFGSAVGCTPRPE
jgi:hypothetical protein